MHGICKTEYNKLYRYAEMRLIGNAVRICSSPLYCECLCGSDVEASDLTVFYNATGELPGRRILNEARRPAVQRKAFVFGGEIMCDC